ncbi:receptor-type tyrosine-protein phosphatase kappa-like isoform X3 [Aquarana catesbeiana]|uniref:receptor-type tyrosine-protein phosphatase kappa-like isoform X3 n=1 Tax=Aquarana catesbeiana TaxID=8400 RepID=UPI003CC9A590
MLGRWTYLVIAVCQVYGLEANESSTAATAVSNLSTTRTENDMDNGTVEWDPTDRPSSTSITCVECHDPSQSNESVCCTISNLSTTRTENDTDNVTVERNPTDRPSSANITCVECDDPSQCNETVCCTRPEAKNLSITSEIKLNYDIGDVVTVSCSTGYRPSSSNIVCESYNGTPQWNVTVQCLGQCGKPSTNNLSIVRHEKEIYDIDDVVTVRCDPGYHPSSTNITCVDRDGFPQWNKAVRCIERPCKRPEISNVTTLPKDKLNYKVNESVEVNCTKGYWPSYKKMTCVQSGDESKWDQTSECIERPCKRPEISNVTTLPKGKLHYKVNESVEVNCTKGYWPSYKKMTCVQSGDESKWDQTSECIERPCKRPEISNVTTLPKDKLYYKVNESVEVNCTKGYWPSYKKMTCVQSGDESKWDQTSECIERPCKRPEISNVTTLPKGKFYYKVNESVEVNCTKGYWPSYKKMTCVQSGDESKWDQTSECIAQCKWPEITNVAESTKYEDYYNVNQSVEVKCKEGYRASHVKMTCRGGAKWDQTSQCIAQCKKPEITNVAESTKYEDYYNVSESVEVTCNEGYWPSYEKMTCLASGDGFKWDHTSQCIGITITDWKVTSTSISFQILCTPHCPQHWRTCSDPKLENYTSCSNLNDKTNVTFTNLQPFSEYGINTTLYINNQTFPLHMRKIRTNESVPDKPIIKKRPTMESQTIRWELSDIRGNITGFQMNISAWRDYNVTFTMDESKRFLRNVTEYKIPLHHGTSYNITLQGFTSAGAGNVTTLSVETEIGDPPCHEGGTMNHSTVQLLPVPDLYGPISFYEILVFGGQEHNMSADCLRFKTVHYNFSRTSSHYTAAVLPALNLTGARTFTLGDNQYYKGFHNAPLIPKHNYTIYIRVTSQWKQVNKSSCAYAGFFEAVTVAGPADSTAQMIAGSLSAVILLLVLLTLVVLWRVRSSGKVMRSSDIQLKAQPGLGKKKDIPVDKFLDVVKRFRMMEIVDTNDNEEEDCAILSVGRYQEYQELPGGLMYLCSVGMSPVNQAKNRYKKVLPYDDSRVVLRSSHSRSDYINASYIDGYKAPKFYIATQGPIPETVSDFWSMVWQENSSVIVMLTGLEEQNKVKCEQYWPEQSQTYGDIIVTVQKIVQTGAFTIRSFSLRKVQSIAHVMVDQIHYLRWPDHGVPKNTSDMVQLVELMNKCNPPGSGPVIVHCSAGIGRTGTFLALDILLKRAREMKKVNVYNCVLELRKRRVKMVQEKEQYIFLYNVLLETLLCGSTSVPVVKIQEHIHRMSVENPTTGMAGVDKEFQALEKITELYQIYPCKEGSKLEHQTKNRNPDILPGDHWRPILLSALTRHGAPGYINAVFVNSNSQDDAMIVTQLPMKHTLADFWALVWDYKCTAVVMMQRAQDLQENGARFWPEKGETCYGAFKVRTMEKNQGHGYTALTLNLRRSKGHSDSSLEVRLFQLDSWPLDRSLPENPAVLISLVGEAEKCQQQTSDSHILVTCCDGAARSGLFCAGVITCDQIRSEGCLDVSQAVRSLRRRRCQFIPNVEQYSFCYTLAQSYLDSFETYGNFK